MPNTAYRVESHRHTVSVTEISYKKRTAKNYMGCRIVGHIFTKLYYMTERQDAAMIRDNLADALDLASHLLSQRIETTKVLLNDQRSRLGELQAIQKTLGCTKSDLTPGPAALSGSSTATTREANKGGA